MQPFRKSTISTNAGIPQSPIDAVQKSSDEHYQIGDTQSNRFIYPNSGPFQHLPMRRTLSGAPALEHPNAHTIFLRDLPAHCYVLPSVPLNFTLVEIIVLLPNWFKNRAVAARFMNNDLTAAIHFMILEEHRHLQFASEKDKEKAKKTIADEYRRTMRKIRPSWTKAGHATPIGWDPTLTAMGGFVPDDVDRSGYRRPASIPFRDLATGVKKVPEGTNAGDLTRALQFALQQPEVYVFPDDLPVILDHIGRTKITTAHTDRLAVRRYDEVKRTEDHAKKHSRQNGPRFTAEDLVARHPRRAPFDRENVPAMMQVMGDGSRYAPAVPFEPYSQPPQVYQNGFNVAETQQQPEQTIWPQEQGLVLHAHTQPSPVHEVDELFRLPKQAGADSANYQAAEPSLEFGVEHSGEAMDALLQPYQSTDDGRMPTPPASPLYPPHQLLRDCIEGNIGFDGSAFAQAARFAQRPDQIGTTWYVENARWLAEMLGATQSNGD
ncbi:hypothetical protein EKO04_008601 [Ascochyta lentis]|uniref:Uncharacterized protein n=1 Tax=Ascochyta lentis TaxID=205686 RepID=A0A8H7MEJ0_9PLEO|nr:hypothetical protein EKO04_008601 [Ascochyta lentis]